MESHDSNNSTGISVKLPASFYERLRANHFDTKENAIQFCRQLCAEYGFNVKKESSGKTGNIYIYCSREGTPDSQRYPNTTRIRKRASKRCQCKWRIVLNMKDGVWFFRTIDNNNNSESIAHNHELLQPGEMEQMWSQEMLDMISELAQTDQSTSDIRTQVQQRFSDCRWNERRFYNRLSTERQKKRKQDTLSRAKTLIEQYTKISMMATVSQGIFDVVQEQLNALLANICQLEHIDPSSLTIPDLFGANDVEIHESNEGKQGRRAPFQDEVEGKKLTIKIPEQSFQVCIPGQRSQTQSARRRSRSVVTNEEEDTSQERPRKKQVHHAPGDYPVGNPSSSQAMAPLTAYNSQPAMCPPNMRVSDVSLPVSFDPHHPSHIHHAHWPGAATAKKTNPTTAPPPPHHHTQVAPPSTTAMSGCLPVFHNAPPMGRQPSPPVPVPFSVYDTQAHRRRSSSSSSSQLSGSQLGPQPPQYTMMQPKMTTPMHISGSAMQTRVQGYHPTTDMAQCVPFPHSHKYPVNLGWSQQTMENVLPPSTLSMPTPIVYPQSMSVYPQTTL